MKCLHLSHDQYLTIILQEKKIKRTKSNHKLDLFLNKSTLILILIICFEILIFYYAILQLLEKKHVGIITSSPAYLYKANKSSFVLAS